jgi:hypothetical protein
MTLQLNQFNEIPVQGQIDLAGFGSNVISARVDNSQATTLVAGQPVKLKTTSVDGVPAVIGLAANTDQAFGFVVYNVKDIEYAANSKLEIAEFGTYMYMTASGTINAGGAVEVVYTTNTVIASGGTNPVVGYAMNYATTGQLVRVYIQAPFSNIQPNLVGRVQTVDVVCTLAEINAGKTLIAGATGQNITVTDFIARVTGTFATGTAVLVQSSNGTPVVVATLAEAAIAGTGIVLPPTANVTLGAGYGKQLGTADGLVVANSGSAQTGGTSIEFTITFVQQ